MNDKLNPAGLTLQPASTTSTPNNLISTSQVVQAQATQSAGDELRTKDTFYFATNPQGQVIGAPTNVDPSLVDSYLKNQQTLYYNPKKGVGTESESKITLDKKTGKITVESSNPSLTSKRAEVVIDRLKLKTLSANYKANKDVAYPISEGATETQTTEEIIASYNKKNEETGLNVIDTYANYYENLDNGARFLNQTHNMIDAEGNITSVNFTDEDMLNYFTNLEAFKTIASTSNDKLTNDTRLHIPVDILENTGVTALESWDSDFQTVGAKDFMEKIWNRQTEDWEKRQVTDPSTGSENLDLYMQLEKYVTGQSYVDENGVRIYTHRDDQTGGLASAISLYNLMTEVDPLCSWWQGAGDIATSVLNGANIAFTKFGEGAATGLTLVMDGMMWIAQNNAKRFAERTGDTLNDDTLKSLYPSRLLAKWAGYGGDTSFYEISGSLAEQFYNEFQADIDKYNNAASAVYTVSEFVTELGIMIAVGNAFANAATAGLAKAAQGVGTIAGRLTQGAYATSDLLATTPTLTNGLMTFWRLTGNVAKGAATTLNILANAMQWKATVAAVSVLGESVGEALVQNPELTGQLLSGADLTDEAREFAWNTVIGNAGGFALGHGASKVLQSLGETTVGMAVSRNMNKLLWTVSTWGGDSTDAIRVMLSDEKTIEQIITNGNTNKIEPRMVKRIQRMAKQLVVEETDYIKILGRSSDEIIADISKYDKVMGKYMAVENAIDHMSARGIYTATALLADPASELGDVYKGFSNTYDELIDLGTAAGLKASKVNGARLLPEEIKNYVTYSQHLDILNAYKVAIQGGLDVNTSIKAIDKEIEYFTTALSTVTEKLSPEIIAKADELVDANRLLWSTWADVRVEKGLLDGAQIKALRDSEQWGEGGQLYVGQMRMTEMPKFTVRRTDGLQNVRVLEELGAYKFGSTEAFVDPMLTFQESLISSAQKYDRMTVLNQFVGTDMVTTKYTSEQLKLVTSVCAGKQSLDRSVVESFKGAMEDIQTGTIIDEIGTLEIKGANLTFVTKEGLEASVLRSIDDMLDGVYENIADANPKVKGILDALVNEYAPEADEVARKVLIYSAIDDNLDAFKKQVQETVYNEVSKRSVNGKMLSAKQSKDIASRISDEVTDNLKTRFDYNRVELSRAGERASTLIDTTKWHKEISDLADEIGDAKAHNPNIVTVRNAAGEIEMVECDPLLASFMNTAAPTAQMSEGMLAKLNYAWMRLFRFGTTGPNPVSWVNQFFRDFGNAWLVGGATQTIGTATDILEEAFGANPSLYLSSFSEEYLAEASAKAQKTGKTLERVLAEGEVDYGTEIVAKQTESEALRDYKRLKNAKYVGGEIKQGSLSRFADNVDKAMQKTDFVNDAREKWLRSRVYANNYAKAVQAGKTASQARTWAEFYASNATTNFTRSTSFLAGIQNTVPYLRSAINGTKSFWRLWQVDPVGVTGRIVGGLVVPMYGLYALTLNSEENREVYRNIKEYQKDNSLAFVVNGEAFFIPLPQEVATVIAPVRQAIEGMYGVNTNSVAELAFSDILGLSPLDLSGFAGLDNYKIFEDGFWERMQAGITKLGAQILPKYANTLVAYTTGRDLYTGNKIDTSYTTIDPDTGEARIMDYSSGQFAKALHSLFPNLSAAMAENIMKNTIGQVGVGLMNWGTDMFLSATGKQDWAQTGENIVAGLTEAVVSPFTAYVPKDEAMVAWRQAVSQMYEYKKELQASDEYRSYIQNARTASTETQINALSVQRQNIVEPYFEKVKEMVSNYQANYGRGLTQTQVASTISLMVLFQNTDAGNPILDQANSDAYNASRASALATMNRFGFPNAGSSDSIFGRLRTSSDGTVYVEYNDPIAVLDFRKTTSIAGDRYRVEIENILSEKGITRTKMFEGYNKLSKKEKKQYKKDWNSKAIRALFPYIDQYGAKNVINNQETVDLLERYIFVDNPYTAKQYLQEVFGGQ